MAADDEVRRLRELIERLVTRATRDVPRYRVGVVGAVHAGTPVTVDVYIAGAAVITPAVPALAHVTGLAGGQKVSIRLVGSDSVVDGRIT